MATCEDGFKAALTVLAWILYASQEGYNGLEKSLRSFIALKLSRQSLVLKEWMAAVMQTPVLNMKDYRARDISSILD